METTNATKEKFYFLNHFHALNSIAFSEKSNNKRAKLGTAALIDVFACYDKTADKDWLEGAIESALKEKDEAKQIYDLAEAIRIEYIGGSISDVEKIGELIKNYVSKDDQHRLFLIIDYLMSSLYGIDLFDVAKELILRYKVNSLFVEENKVA